MSTGNGLALKRIQATFMITLALLVGACGFHLRGSVELPPVLRVTYLKADDSFSGMAFDLRNELKAAGAEIAEQPEGATAVLNIISQRSDQRVLSVGSTGKASEYELFNEIAFSLESPQGEILLAAQTVRVKRDLVFDQNALLGKVSESERIRREMRRSLARQVITRIQVGMQNK